MTSQTVKSVTMPIVIRIGDNSEHQIGIIEADSWRVAKSQIANALREAADLIEAEGE